MNEECKCWIVPTTAVPLYEVELKTFIITSDWIGKIIHRIQLAASQAVLRALILHIQSFIHSTKSVNKKKKKKKKKCHDEGQDQCDQ